MTKTGASGIREVFRLAPPVVFWWIWIVFVVVNVVDYAVQGLPSARFGVALGIGLLVATGVIYALALRPKVIADASGVTVVNPLRTHHIPWSRIESVDTGEWVRIRYTPAPSADAPGKDAPGEDAPGEDAPGEDAPGEDAQIAGAQGEDAPGKDAQIAGAQIKTVHCWALYVSASARRKIARGPAAVARAGIWRRLGSLAQPPGATPDSPLPEEARYLASLPPAKAIAVRLDTRARRERARAASFG